MMTDLFSSLDGNHSIFFWTPPLLFTSLFLWTRTWLSNSVLIYSDMCSSPWASAKGVPSRLFLQALFTTLISLNLLGLAPFIYPVTSSLWVNSSLALLLWLSVLLSGWSYSFKKSAAHLVPSGAPIILIPFLIIIETISILIRPLTLTVRLVANISAGHIIMSLLASVLSSNISMMSTTLFYIVMVAYNMFEVFVALIQAYIFTLLVSLYMEEHP
uniref:ATP synthase subunit a n=1 Tax=Euphaedusa planostriata TaxID=2798995 RepID=A0A7T7IF18_9EUPU|nr:ATP synthase F0 subunit 6 [Euphaedusa planostriata]QQL04605.1 ATP synthase F0 subunit 6 [Euphaedusa planostriata]